MSTIKSQAAAKTPTDTSLEKAFLVLIKFLMLSKHRAIDLGTEYGLTGMQTFMVLLLEEPRPMYSFKKVFNCDASNITGLVDGLEQKELASRYESQEDRRIKMVRLDEHGRAVRRALLRKIAAHDGPVFTRLNPHEFQTFIKLLQKVTGDQ
jgi:DNA-binding MarR family transcriptional regulator